MSAQDDNYFIKTSDMPLLSLTREQKAKLNRKGNLFYNEGNIESAKRIFLATGYSDGLGRVGDYCLQQGQFLQAWKLYMLAHDKAKAEHLTTKFARVVRLLLQEN